MADGEGQIRLTPLALGPSDLVCVSLKAPISPPGGEWAGGRGAFCSEMDYSGRGRERRRNEDLASASISRGRSAKGLRWNDFHLAGDELKFLCVFCWIHEYCFGGIRSQSAWQSISSYRGRTRISVMILRSRKRKVGEQLISPVLSSLSIPRSACPRHPLNVSSSMHPDLYLQ